MTGYRQQKRRDGSWCGRKNKPKNVQAESLHGPVALAAKGPHLPTTSESEGQYSDAFPLYTVCEMNKGGYVQTPEKWMTSCGAAEKRSGLPLPPLRNVVNPSSPRTSRNGPASITSKSQHGVYSHRL